MKRILAGVRDVPARALIGVPMLFPHVAVATRWFGDLLADPQSACAKHPTDYELVHYGWYDEEADMFEAQLPALLLSGADWLSAVSERVRDA